MVEALHFLSQLLREQPASPFQLPIPYCVKVWVCLHLPLVLGAPGMGRKALNGRFPATFSGESLGPRTLTLKGCLESSNPSLLLADGETEAQRGPYHC